MPQDRFGGLHHSSDCDVVFANFPADAAACRWMFSSDAPFPFPSPGVLYPGSATIVSSRPVNCPASLNARSGCSSPSP